uniref:Uncharacterized protein n=1 Tax=Brassica oleracea var. oleracea TaxID=109376 RepID=A0A0D3B3U4_BRAOL
MHAASKELKIRATSSVSELQRSTPSSDVNMTAEFELELQELFNDVKSMVKIGVRVTQWTFSELITLLSKKRSIRA